MILFSEQGAKDNGLFHLSVMEITAGRANRGKDVKQLDTLCSVSGTIKFQKEYMCFLLRLHLQRCTVLYHTVDTKS
jgi:hypothetical protein